MELNHLPVIDWDLGIRLAGNKKELAKEMLDMLLTNLKIDLTEIESLYERKNYASLLHKIHKLHGAVCYCGIPRLKIILTQLEKDLKTNTMENLSTLFEQLKIEAERLYNECHKEQSLTE